MTFKPEDHMMKIKGEEYLATIWRVVWVRDEHPDAQIDTEVVFWDHDKQEIMIRAVVVLPATGARATGHCVGTLAEFKFGYVEKCETQAVGRALALLGYGTAFAGQDFDEGEGERPADSPVAAPAARNGNGSGPSSSKAAASVKVPQSPARGTAEETSAGAGGIATARHPEEPQQQSSLLAAPQTSVPASVPQDIPGLIRCIEAEAGVSIQGIFTLRDWRDLARTYGAPTPAGNKDLTRAWMIDLLGHIHAGNGTQVKQGPQQQQVAS